MSQNKSDYTLPRTNIHSMLPTIHQGALMDSMSEATFNRFLTKPELTRVIGTIGNVGDRSKQDQIVEPTVFDQAFQLQPAIISNIGTDSTDVITYADLVRIGGRIGIDFEKVDQWQSTDQYNYCPPINLDKLINYGDYFWVDTLTLPQYIVIHNKQIKLQAELRQMVRVFLDSDVAGKSVLCPDIYTKLHIIQTVVAATDRLTIPDLNLVLFDSVYVGYRPAAPILVDKKEYELNSDWSKSNKWVHRLDLDDVASATVASMPIIEYNDTLAETGWSYTKHVWKYRASAADAWTDTNNGPSRDELLGTPIITSKKDPWLGFNQHWLYVKSEPPVPVVAQQVWDVLPDTTVVSTGDISKINTSKPIQVGKNLLRVYVDGVRQYGTYFEVDQYNVQFYKAPKSGARIEIFTQVACALDLGKESVVLNGKEVNLVEYRLEEQQKTQSNEYPKFDLVRLDGTPLYESSSIFAYEESPDYPVHPIVGKRIVYDNTTRDYGFVTGLVSDDATLKYYIDSNAGLSSIWMKDITGKQYIPTKVDVNRKPSTDVDAVWEIPHPFVNNIAHECRNTLRLSELFIHYRSIIEAQSLTAEEMRKYGSDNAQSYRLLSTINYGAGGTIKEYNHNMANFVSSLINSEYTTIDVIDFAEKAYQTNLMNARQIVEANVVSVLTSGDIATRSDVVGSLASVLFDTIRRDITQSTLYSDSSVSTASVLKNWIATLPYINMGNAVQPEVLYDKKLGIVNLVHHDGHSLASEVSDVANIRQQLVALATKASVTPTSPAQTGDMVYNVVTDTLYRWSTLGWSVLDVTNIVLSVLLRLEQALYATAPKSDNVAYDLAGLAATYPTEFNNLQRLEFERYCSDQNVTSPYQGDYVAADPFTWSYAGAMDYAKMYGSVPGTNPNIRIPKDKWAARWKDLYKNIYGTEHPNLQPWKLQKFDTKPTWWDAVYASKSGRRWVPLMWKNIMAGIVPTPTFDASSPTWNLPDGKIAVLVTSVNISDRTVGGYGPDDLLPPYWLSTDPVINSQSLLGSGFAYASLRVSANEYEFGANGPKEHNWRNSINFRYSQLRTAYQLDPIRFFNRTFGEQFTKVQGLDICNRTGNVLSHKDVVFHGDADKTGVKQYFAGLNQWYVQLFRQLALYGNSGTAQQVWTGWTTQLSYNTGAFVVDNTMAITSSRFPITPNDYSVRVKIARKVRDLWIDALYVTVDQAGSFRELPQGSGRDWKFNIGLRSPMVRDVSYYGVKKYRIAADPISNTFTFMDGMTLERAGWKLGSAIMLDTGANGLLPTAIDDQTYYYIIPRPSGGTNSITSFAIGAFEEDALANRPISLLSSGSGIMYVAELESTFHAFESQNTATLWKHFVIDKSDIRTFSSSISVTGIQNIVDVVDGYVQYLVDAGFVFNDSSVPEYDENDRLITWQYELESMINYLYLQIGTISTFSQNGIAFQVGEIELNPFRNNLWINHPTGMVSEFNNNRHASSQAFVYDRDGNKVLTKDYHILRKDQCTHFVTLTQENADLQTNNVSYQYGNTSIAGIRMFFDEYEHVILFNPRTVSQSFIYDAFLGIAIPRVQAYFEKQNSVTKRPNVGGFVLQDGDLCQNYEYTVGNIQHYYDTFTVNENSNFVDHARALLGYKAGANYFSGSSTTPKSQFLFYKGMVKAKGTLASMTAYAGSNQSATAEVDEFWAYKTLEFGDNRSNVSYTVNLNVDDTAGSHLLLQFVPSGASVAENEFTKVDIADSARWADYPSQMSNLATMDKAFGTTPVAMFSMDTTKHSGSVLPQLPHSEFLVIEGKRSINGTAQHRVLLVHDDATAVSLYVRDVVVDGTTSIHRQTFVVDNATKIKLGFNYVPNSNSLDVYVDGTIVTTFSEPSDDTIAFNKSTTGVVVVVKKIGTLKEGVHYARVNSRTVELFSVAPESVQIVKLEASYAQSMPVKIYDKAAQVVVSDVPAWDPRKGWDLALLSQAVDISAMDDPARYTVVPDAAAQDLRLCWGPAEVGTIWKDTRSYGYVPYADLTRELHSKLSTWGNLAEWSDPTVYQWVKSTTAPSMWTENDGTPHKEVYARSRIVVAATGVELGTGNILLEAEHDIVINDEIILFGVGLPAPLLASTIYVVSGINEGKITLAHRDGTPITITSNEDLDFRVTKASYTNGWKKVIQEIEYHEMLEVKFGQDSSVPTMRASLTEVAANVVGEYVNKMYVIAGYVDGSDSGDGGDPDNDPEGSTLHTNLADHTEVTVYINGIYAQDSYVLDSTIELDPEIFIRYRDRAELYQITIVSKTGILDGLPSVRPANIDLDETSSQMYTEFPYTRMEHTSELGIAPEPLYFFWARNVSNMALGVMTQPLEYMISHNDSAYAVCMNPTLIAGNQYLNQLIIAGASGIVTDMDRYVLRLINNETLRDAIPNYTVNKVHTQWAMFRQNQVNSVERSLWDKITESIVGYKIDNPTMQVPSWDRAIYDSLHNTYTRYGLGEDQAFMDGEQAKVTILSMINSATIDYAPIDMDAFLDRFKFTTPSEIVACMDAIYVTFPAKHVNNIFFTVMHDALANHRVDYSRSLMKTSMISLTGTIPLNVNGALDE